MTEKLLTGTLSLNTNNLIKRFVTGSRMLFESIINLLTMVKKVQTLMVLSNLKILKHGCDNSAGGRKEQEDEEDRERGGQTTLRTG